MENSRDKGIKSKVERLRDILDRMSRNDKGKSGFSQQPWDTALCRPLPLHKRLRKGMLVCLSHALPGPRDSTNIQLKNPKGMNSSLQLKPTPQCEGSGKALEHLQDLHGIL